MMIRQNGSITASCGHKLADDEDTVSVKYGEYDCDPIDGFHPCIVYAEFCPTCTEDWQRNGWLFQSEEEAEAWCDSERKPKPRRS